MTAKSHAIPKRSNLRKMDAHVIARKEYEEIPELTEADLRRAQLRVGGRKVTRREFSAAIRTKLGKNRFQNEGASPLMLPDMRGHFSHSEMASK